MTEAVDAAKGAVQETRTTAIPFRELAAQDTIRRVRNPKEKDFVPVNIHFFGRRWTPNGPVAFIGVSFDPAILYGRAGLLGGRLYHVSDSGRDTLIVGQSAQPESMEVYNVSPDQARGSDTTDMRKIDPADVMVAATEADAIQLGSWIVDPEIRKLAEDYAKNG